MDNNTVLELTQRITALEVQVGMLMKIFYGIGIALVLNLLTSFMNLIKTHTIGTIKNDKKTNNNINTDTDT